MSYLLGRERGSRLSSERGKSEFFDESKKCDDLRMGQTGNVTTRSSLREMCIGGTEYIQGIDEPT